MNTGLPVVLHADDDPNDLLLFKHACRSADLPFVPLAGGSPVLLSALLTGADSFPSGDSATAVAVSPPVVSEVSGKEEPAN